MATPNPLTVPLYRITKLHTAGLLAGLTTKEETTAKFKVGLKVEKAIGGGSYEVTGCECIGTRTY